MRYFTIPFVIAFVLQLYCFVSCSMSEIFVRLLFSIANRAHVDISWIVFPLFFSFIAFPCAQFHLFSSCQSSKPCFRIEHGLSIWESLKYSFISMGLLQMSTNLSIVWKIFVFWIDSDTLIFYFIFFILFLLHIRHTVACKSIFFILWLSKL